MLKKCYLPVPFLSGCEQHEGRIKRRCFVTSRHWPGTLHRYVDSYQLQWGRAGPPWPAGSNGNLRVPAAWVLDLCVLFTAQALTRNQGTKMKQTNYGSKLKCAVPLNSCSSGFRHKTMSEGTCPKEEPWYSDAPTRDSKINTFIRFFSLGGNPWLVQLALLQLTCLPATETRAWGSWGASGPHLHTVPSVQWSPDVCGPASRSITCPVHSTSSLSYHPSQ